MTTTAPPPEALATASKAEEEAMETGRAMNLEELEAAFPITTEAKATAAVDAAELKLRRELGASLAGRTRLGVVDALIAGTLHPAVSIDWSMV